MAAQQAQSQQSQSITAPRTLYSVAGQVFTDPMLACDTKNQGH